MGLAQSKLHLPEPNSEEMKENKRVRDCPPASSYSKDEAIEEGRKLLAAHEERMDSFEVQLDRGVTACNTILDRVNYLEQKLIDQQQKDRERSGLLDTRLSELEARFLDWNQDQNQNQQPNQNQFQDRVQEEQIPIADEVQGGRGDPVHQGQDMDHQGQDMDHQGQDMGHQGQDIGHQGQNMDHQGQDMGHEVQDMGHQGQGHGQRRKIRCEYCGNSLSEGPYIHRHIRFHCTHAPLELRAVRRVICSHCQKTLSIQTMKRHLAVPGAGRRRRMGNNV